MEDLRAKLTNKNDRQEIKESSSHGTKNAMPDDLVQIQSYIRWERAGKPNYSADQQLVNYISFANCFQQLLFYYKVFTLFIYGINMVEDVSHCLIEVLMFS